MMRLRTEDELGRDSVLAVAKHACFALGLTCLGVGAPACVHPKAYAERTVPSPQPTQIRREAGLLVAQAQVNGEKVELVLDLGSAHPLTLPLPDLQRTHAIAMGEVVRYHDATGTPLSADVYDVAELAWAGVTWRHVRAVEARWSGGFSPPVRAGVLGLPLFRSLRLALRVMAGEARVEPSRPCGASGIAMKVDHGLLLDARLDSEPVTTLLDTAATHDVATSFARSGRHRLTLGELDVGTIDLAGAELPGVPADLMLGTPFLARYAEVDVDLGAGCVEAIP